MINKLHAHLLRIATRRHFLILLTVFIGINLLLLSPLSPFTTLLAYSGGVGLLDVIFLYTPDTAYDVLTAYGAAGRDYYLSVLFPIDLVTPILMNLFLSLTITLVLRRAFPPDAPVHRLNLLPVVAMAADYLENGAIVALILAYPARLDGVAVAAAAFTAVKFIATFASALTLAFGLAAWLRAGRSLA